MCARIFRAALSSRAVTQGGEPTSGLTWLCSQSTSCIQGAGRIFRNTRNGLSRLRQETRAAPVVLSL